MLNSTLFTILHYVLRERPMLRTGRRGRSDAVRAMRPAKLECPTCRFAARRESGELAMVIGSLVTSHSLVENGVVEQT
jgi:hypothetical protein